MNFTKKIVTLTLVSLLFMSCKENTKETTVATNEKSTPKVKKEIAAANLQTASFTIEGMSCQINCANTIQRELSGLDGVQSATVEFDKKLGTVTFDKTALTTESLVKVIQATGDGETYKVSRTN